MARRPRPPYETPEFLACIRRMIRAAGRRVGEGDPEELAELVNIRAELDEAIASSVVGLRREGFTWQSIGEATGTTRQAAIGKWATRARAALGSSDA